MLVMSMCAITVLMMLALLIAVFTLFAVWSCLRRVTFCLTFDDGLKMHYTIAASLLEEYGWRGAFNVPTGLIGLSYEDLSSTERSDLCVDENSMGFMTWEEVNDLLQRGHDVFPHAHRHRDIVNLIRVAGFAEAKKEILDSANCYLNRTGVRPVYFCLPHNTETPEARNLIHKCGMQWVNVARLNFGERRPPGATISVAEHVARQYYAGRTHIDIMIHGITRASGGWRPFENEKEFRTFLDDVRKLEDAGRIRVVRYSDSHVKYDWLYPLSSRICWLSAKIRRVVFKVTYQGFLRECNG